MSEPSFLPPPRSEIRNGKKKEPLLETASKPSPNGLPSFVAPFLGAFAAVFLLALVVGGIYLGSSWLHSSSSKEPKTPLLNVASWQEGPVNQSTLMQPVKPDVGWWTRTFDLPNQAQVVDYLKKQGLTVNSVEPVHYDDTKDATNLTYQVNIEVPGELLRVPQSQWASPSPEVSHFAGMLVLNQGLPPGTYWDTSHARVEAAANEPRSTLFNIHYNKLTNVVTADRLLPHDLVNRQQMHAYQVETDEVIASLEHHLQQIDAQVKLDTDSRLAQVPADPPKPKPQTAHFGGDGSGEPTKSAARIGGGAAAGAAGGAAFGAIAGNAGMGAGIGAGVGLLSGIIYNAVSKSNDKKKLEREVADQNAERLDNWRAEIKSLKQQRAQIQQDAINERQAALDNLANQIAANQGHLADGGMPVVPPPQATSPAGMQPTGPN